MLRVSWPLAIFLAAVIAVVARRPRMLVPVLIVLGVWLVWRHESASGRPGRHTGRGPRSALQEGRGPVHGGLLYGLRDAPSSPNRL